MDAGDSDWLTWPQAANVADCPVPTIDRYSRQGLIKKRPHRGSRPTLSRASVEEFAEWWRAHQEERERKRAAEAVLVQKRAELRERARRLGVKPSRVPPLDDEVTGWVTTDEAGAILGLSRQHTIRVVRDAG